MLSHQVTRLPVGATELHTFLASVGAWPDCKATGKLRANALRLISRQDGMRDFAMHVRQTEIAAAKTKRQAFVIQAE